MVTITYDCNNITIIYKFTFTVYKLHRDQGHTLTTADVNVAKHMNPYVVINM